MNWMFMSDSWSSYLYLENVVDIFNIYNCNINLMFRNKSEKVKKKHYQIHVMHVG